MLKWNLDSCWGMVDITGPYLCHRKRIKSLENWDKTISNVWKYLKIYIEKQKPEHCHRVQTKGRPRVSSFWALQSTLSQTSEQCRVSCIPAHSKKRERCKQNLLRKRVKQECCDLWSYIVRFFLLPLVSWCEEGNTGTSWFQSLDATMSQHILLPVKGGKKPIAEQCIRDRAMYIPKNLSIPNHLVKRNREETRIVPSSRVQYQPNCLQAYWSTFSSDLRLLQDIT